MNDIPLLSPLTEFVEMILEYFIDIWNLLLFVAVSSSMIVVLIGAILMFVGVKVGKITGSKLILGGILLSIICIYFALFPPDFVLG